MAERVNKMLARNEPVKVPRLDDLLDLLVHFYMHGIPLDAKLLYRTDPVDSDTEFDIGSVLHVQKTSDTVIVTLGGSQ